MSPDSQQTFSPGIKIILESPSLFNQKFSSYFRGYKLNQYVIIEQPIHNNRPVPIDEETEVMVRFIENGRAYGFKAEVLGVAKRPYPLLFISFPQVVESSNLRRDERYPVRLKAAYSNEKMNGDASEKIEGQILNLSNNGCLLSSPEPAEAESYIFLSIPFPEQGLVTNLEAEVKACRKTGMEFHLGLNFLDKLDPQHKKIEGYLDNLKALQVRV